MVSAGNILVENGSIARQDDYSQDYPSCEKKTSTIIKEKFANAGLPMPVMANTSISQNNPNSKRTVEPLPKEEISAKSRTSYSSIIMQTLKAPEMSAVTQHSHLNKLQKQINFEERKKNFKQLAHKVNMEQRRLNVSDKNTHKELAFSAEKAVSQMGMFSSSLLPSDILSNGQTTNATQHSQPFYDGMFLNSLPGDKNSNSKKLELHEHFYLKRSNPNRIPEVIKTSVCSTGIAHYLLPVGPNVDVINAKYDMYTCKN